jgi:parallel beta-helix repeat protein
MRRGLVFTLLPAVALMMLLAFSGAQAFANHVECGDVLTQDTELDSDLQNCPGNGVVVGADNIELDLDGHTIDGDGVLGCTEQYACDFGIDNRAGHRGVEIKDGSVREFATGIVAFGASDNEVEHISWSDNILGGLLFVGCTQLEIERNSVAANGLTTDQAGLIVFDSSDVEIARNSVSANGDIGMFLIGVGDSQIERNSVSGNPETGIVLEGNGNALSRNRVFENGDNLVLIGNDNSVTRNDIADALGVPDDPAGGFGVLIDGGDRNLLQGNDIDGAASNGIRVTAFDPGATGESDDNVIRSNEVERTGLDGILVDETAPGTLVKGNVVVEADDDGIDVESPASTLTGNLALRNGDLGIEAVPGVTDGGGNRAFANGNPLQCVNVSCKSKRGSKHHE